MGLNPHIGMPGLVGVCLRRPDSQASPSHLSHFKGFAIHLAVTHSSIHWLACLLTLFTHSFIRSFVGSFIPSFLTLQGLTGFGLGKVCGIHTVF